MVSGFQPPVPENMTSSEDTPPTTLWALLGRGEKKTPVFLDGECSEEGPDVYITLENGRRFDMQEKDVLWMYTATTCFCCGCREREILCHPDSTEDGMDDFFNRYSMLKSIEAGQDVRNMSRLELRYRDGMVLSVGMTCDDKRHTAYFRGVAEAVEQKLGLTSCRKTSGPGHGRSKTAAPEVADAEPEADAEADRHMRELLALESGKSAGQRHRKKVKPARSKCQEVPPVPDEPSNCSAQTAEEQDCEEKSESALLPHSEAQTGGKKKACNPPGEACPAKQRSVSEPNISQSEVSAPSVRTVRTTSGSCSLVAESGAQADADRPTQELLASASHNDEPVRQHRSSRAKAARKLSQDSSMPVPDQPSQLALAQTATCSAKTAELQDSEEASKSNSEIKVPLPNAGTTIGATNSGSASCTLVAESDAHAQTDRHMQELLAPESEVNKSVRQRNRKKTEAARPIMQEVPPDSSGQQLVLAQAATEDARKAGSQEGEEDSETTAPSEASSPRAITNWNSFTLVQGRKPAKGPKVDAKPELVCNSQRSSNVSNRGQFPQSNASETLATFPHVRSSRAQSYGNVEQAQDLAVVSKTVRAESWSSSCNGQGGQYGMPKASCPIAASSEPKSFGKEAMKRPMRITAPCPTSQPPPVPETREIDEGILQHELDRVKVALDESLARQTQDFHAERGLGVRWGIEQKPEAHCQDHVQQELDQVKAALGASLAREDELLQVVESLRKELNTVTGVSKALDESLARESELSQLVVSLRSEVGILKGTLTKQSVDAWEEVGRFKPTCLELPPGIELQSVSPHEPMKVQMASFSSSTRKYTDDASVTSTVCCADEDCGCETENWLPAQLAGDVINENASLESMHWWASWCNDHQAVPW